MSFRRLPNAVKVSGSRMLALELRAIEMLGYSSELAFSKLESDPGVWSSKKPVR